MVLRHLLRHHLLFGLCMLPCGCGTSSNTEIKNLAEIQRQARITIPASARNVRCASDAVHRGPDTATYGRFDIPAADLPLVLAAMPEGNKVRPFKGYSNVMVRQKSEPWWQPETLTQKRVVDWSMAGYSVNLLIGNGGDEGIVTVYFFNFST